MQVILVLWSIWVEEITVDFMYSHIAVWATDPIISTGGQCHKWTGESVTWRDRVISKSPEAENDAAFTKNKKQETQGGIKELLPERMEYGDSWKKNGVHNEIFIFYWGDNSFQGVQ